MLFDCNADSHYDECLAEGSFFIVMLSVIMLSVMLIVAFYCYAECHYDEFGHLECIGFSHSSGRANCYINSSPF